ncbi:luciferase [Mycobacterium rhizamassiliense]|uniref:Luciferase n=1 Tax=Mycobacterium rhizamassiliense TaxID=1841860 RepID=A0A2U3NU78_9MYCO|nr:LLM class flavin-dependent oxidoreductase [Mycobacterium rhizamassiliense]SPM35059.1 luciferase [Mycobacterium rhizamassiliense]
MEIGVYGVHFPPFELATGAAVGAEAAGMDFIIYGDQLCFTHPSSLWTPDITDVATLLPTFNAFMDTGPIIAAAAAQTSTIKFHYGVIDAVRRPPSVIAQSLLTLDHATKGRVRLLLANGENKQMKPYGIARKGANEKLSDSLRMVQKFLRTTDPVSDEGIVWKHKDAIVAVHPYGDTPPPVYVAGGGPEVLELIGEYADGWFTYIPGASEDTPERFAEDVATVREHAERAGRDPGSIKISVTMITVLDEDEANLAELREHPFVLWNTMLATPTSATYTRWGLTHPYGENWMFSRDCIPPWISREEALDVCARTPREAIDKVQFVGTSAQVLERLAPYLDLGVIDELSLVNYAELCGVKYMASAGEAIVALLSKVKGIEPATGPGVTTLVTEGLST